MKRCPECRRDYYDDSLLYCLDDGKALLEGPATFGADGPATAILSEPGAIAAGFRGGEDQTRPQIHTTEQTALPRTGAEAETQKSVGDASDKHGFSANRAAKPVVIVGVAVVLLVVGFFSYRYFNTSATQIESIAVMPFVNESGNADAEYLSDGMTETLINSLSQLPNLNVKGRASVFRYKGKELEFKKIASELNVQAILTGRVVQRGDKMTLNIELIDAQSENVLWGNKYERKAADLVTLQSDVARDVSSRLKTRLSGADAARVEKRYTANPEAYELYLKGKFFWNKRTPDALKQSADYYKQAIAKDPQFAIAYAALAQSYVLYPAYGNASSNEIMPLAKAAASRALEIDDSVPGAHDALGYYLANFAWDMEAAERAFRRAIELNPNDATAFHWLANTTLLPLGRNDEAIAAGRRAEELDPLSPIIAGDSGSNLYYARRYDEAITQLKHALTLDPNFYTTRTYLGVAYDAKGMHKEAIAEFRRAQDLDDDPWVKACLVRSLAKSGEHGEALKRVAELRSLSSTRYVGAWLFAISYAALGKKDEAFSWLEKDFIERSGNQAGYSFDPALDVLRDDPRLSELIRRVAAGKLN